MKQLVTNLNNIKIGDSIYVSDSKNALAFLVKDIYPCPKRLEDCTGKCLRKTMTIRGIVSDYNVCLSEFLGVYKDLNDTIINKVVEI